MINQEAKTAPLASRIGGAQQIPTPGRQVIRVTDPAFFTGIQKAPLDFERKYKPQVTSSGESGTTIDDTGIPMMFLMATVVWDQSAMWKAGGHFGFFAALSGILYRWRVRPTEAILHSGITGRRRAS
jgi:hypothetical protein